MKDLEGKVAVVTGAASGIGRALVRAFGEAGMKLACADIDLGRWFGEVYAVPAAEPGYDEDETPEAPRPEPGKPS